MEEIINRWNELTEVYHRKNVLLSELEELVYPYLLDYNRYTGYDTRDNYEHEIKNCCLTKLTGQSFIFYGEESWRYGGHDEWTFDLPIQFIIDSDYREGLKMAWEKKMDEQLQHIEAKKKENQRKKFETYLKLKEEFES